uniref:PHD-type domain-containing protein n=1 Tax=Timema poppense TaxID=170557 RepID=A0A7R9HCY4_TIMPO|nr:unnamed protein product [Timema poppensis]
MRSMPRGRNHMFFQGPGGEAQHMQRGPCFHDDRNDKLLGNSCGMPLGSMGAEFKPPVGAMPPEPPPPAKKKRRSSNANSGPPAQPPPPIIQDLLPPPLTGYGDTIVASNPFDDSPPQVSMSHSHHMHMNHHHHHHHHHHMGGMSPMGGNMPSGPPMGSPMNSCPPMGSPMGGGPMGSPMNNMGGPQMMNSGPPMGSPMGGGPMGSPIHQMGGPPSMNAMNNGPMNAMGGGSPMNNGPMGNMCSGGGGPPMGSPHLNMGPMNNMGSMSPMNHHSPHSSHPGMGPIGPPGPPNMHHMSMHGPPHGFPGPGMGPKPMPVSAGKVSLVQATFILRCGVKIKRRFIQNVESSLFCQIYPPDQPMVFNPQNPNAPPIYPCGTCHKEVHDNDQAILCESGCNFWFHRVCTGLTEAAYQLLTAEVYAEWVCDKCLSSKNIPLVKFKP